MSSNRGRAPLEIDNDLSQIAVNLEEEEKGILRTVQMGGTQALNEIAEYNQDVGKIAAIVSRPSPPATTLIGNASASMQQERESMQSWQQFRTNISPAVSKTG